MPTTTRPATAADLPAINRVIEAAVMTWDLPERVKRLSLPSYRYTAHDLDHLAIVVAEDGDDTLVGVAGWEHAETADCPAGKTGLLLHGLYVDPARHHQGIGSALLAAAIKAASGTCDGLLVKAQADAAGFFHAQGLVELPVQDQARHYRHRYWLALTPDDRA